MSNFAWNQIGKLFRFLGMSVVIAYIVTWVAGAVVEFVVNDQLLSPIWLLEIFW